MRNLNDISYVLGEDIVIKIPLLKLKQRLYEHIGENLCLWIEITPKNIDLIMANAESFNNYSVINTSLIKTNN